MVRLDFSSSMADCMWAMRNHIKFSVFLFIFLEFKKKIRFNIAVIGTVRLLNIYTHSLLVEHWTLRMFLERLWFIHIYIYICVCRCINKLFVIFFLFHSMNSVSSFPVVRCPFENLFLFRFLLLPFVFRICQIKMLKHCEEEKKAKENCVETLKSWAFNIWFESFEMCLSCVSCGWIYLNVYVWTLD